jgi:hypothetical protein
LQKCDTLYLYIIDLGVIINIQHDWSG